MISEGWNANLADLRLHFKAPESTGLMRFHGIFEIFISFWIFLGIVKESEYLLKNVVK